ncbi:hypothetical protein SGPA1_20837 [Streptomyces misionensis JCM 4497]
MDRGQRRHPALVRPVAERGSRPLLRTAVLRLARRRRPGGRDARRLRAARPVAARRRCARRTHRRHALQGDALRRLGPGAVRPAGEGRRRDLRADRTVLGEHLPGPGGRHPGLHRPRLPDRPTGPEALSDRLALRAAYPAHARPPRLADRPGPGLTRMARRHVPSRATALTGRRGAAAAADRVASAGPLVHPGDGWRDGTRRARKRTRGGCQGQLLCPGCIERDEHVWRPVP